MNAPRPHFIETPQIRFGDAARPADHRVLRVLVVDDDWDSAEMCAMLVASMGCRVFTAHDGEEGVALARQFAPDIAIFDLEMPRLTGHEAARLIRHEEWGHRMVLISVSGLDAEIAHAKSREAGFDAHQVKPLDPVWLEAQIVRGQRTLAAH